MDRYGSDRPDLRWGLEIRDWTAVLRDLEFRVVSGAIEAGGRARGLHLVEGGRLSRKEIEALESVAKAAGAPGLLWARRTDEGVSGSLSRFLTEAHVDELGLAEGDLILVAAGEDRVTSPALAAVRTAAIRALELPVERPHAWLWVTDFPLFDDDEGRLASNHHPFVLPHGSFLESLEDEPLAARGLAYDLVYNGSEFGSGSLRIHDAALQRRILGLLGMAAEEIERRFGFLLSALEAGAPPHGGIALGVDRIVQRFAGTPSLRDVMAFPKTTAARALFEGAPTPVAARDLEELGLRLRSASGA
jgi:aspartyl-tRNA synthetase